MLRLTVTPGETGDQAIRTAAARIVAGGVVAYPTDTLYGLGADPRNADAIRQVFAIKGRPDDKPLPLIAGNLDAAEGVAILTPLARRLAGRFWPGPLTLVVQAHSSIVAEVHGGTGRVGIRVPAHAVARALAEAAGGAVTATSANRSGDPPGSDPDEVAALAAYGLPTLLDAGPSPGGPPSTVLDVTGHVPLLLRPGAVAWERVLESLRAGAAD
jgi:L-threonylcarbamoyladenylate synthase